MEFYIEKHSSTPIIHQIQEQIKLAVAMGIFRSGDTLPSIRDIEKQTGINRSQIHKAYLALRQSGLLLLTRGKGTVVAVAADSPASVNESCRRLSGKITSQVRRMGLSPTAFARYLSRHAQESERNSPFLSYVDTNKEVAVQTAAEISRLWHVPVAGMAFRELKTAVGGSAPRQKILVNQFLYEDVRSLFPKGKAAVIPVLERESEQTIKTLQKIKSNSSVMFLHRPQPSHRVRFVLAHLREMLEPRGIIISHAEVRNISSFRNRLNKSRCDYYLVGPAVRGEIPPEMRQNPRILPINPRLDPASLEAARIRAGVII